MVHEECNESSDDYDIAPAEDADGSDGYFRKSVTLCMQLDMST
jgi:hypothetical protein